MSPRLESLCAQEARLANAPLIGTATRVDVWFLLEYPETWGNRAFEECHLPERVKQSLASQAAAIPNARIQLVKHRSRGALPEVLFSVVLSREIDPVCYAFELPRYEALLDLDLTAVLSASSAYDSHIGGTPLYLVCTNARRDACCASRGLPVYEKLSGLIGPSVWQTTHVGGHRYAANLVCLPHGIYYGRIDDIDPLMLIREYEQGRVVPPFLRGRCCYDPAVQAAESFLHTHNTGLEMHRYRLSRAEREGPDQWTVCFVELDGTQHVLALAAESAGEVRTGCGSHQREPVTLYHLKEYSQRR